MPIGDTRALKTNSLVPLYYTPGLSFSENLKLFFILPRWENDRNVDSPERFLIFYLSLPDFSTSMADFMIFQRTFSQYFGIDRTIITKTQADITIHYDNG